ncbi:hypothetical protein [Winogradskyella alexanderae]|uniref:Uncharacterized protein n=1 Tax=Winogradskyella alexanderae TaxID=2877123 RepID=A0ABS7XWU7_9FLAO|nr:hypothetical protein [Winogradskyella alexanderae]MCA0133869.1 hypothetical protein [Winogradskyella alexanderae]
MREEFYFQLLINQLNNYTRNKMLFGYLIRLSLIILILISIIKFPLKNTLSIAWFITAYLLIFIWMIFDRNISRKIIVIQEEIADGIDSPHLQSRYIKNYKKLEQEHLYRSGGVFRIYSLLARKEYMIWIFLFVVLLMLNFLSPELIETLDKNSFGRGK